jgi:hypothetical protein
VNVSLRAFGIVQATLPIVAVVVAFWGLSWGWDIDSELLLQLPYFVGLAYLLTLAPCLVLKIRRARSHVLVRRIEASRISVLLVWGIYSILTSLVLIWLFSSDALWLGSVSILYVGFVLSIFGVITMLLRAGPR